MDTKDLLLLFGGSQVVLNALVAWIGKLWLSRLAERERHALEIQLERVKSEHQLALSTQLEHLRADFTRQQAVLTSAIGAASSAETSSHPMRLRAIESLWAAVLCERNAGLDAIMWWDMNYALEGPENLKRPAVRQRMLQKVTLDSIAQVCKSENDQLERLRPFLGEAMWSLYFGYRMLIGRASVSIAVAVERNQDPEPWYEDKEVCHLLESVLTADELEELTRRKFQKLKWVMTRFEDNILRQAAGVISGTAAAQQSYQQSEKILEAAERIERASPLHPRPIEGLPLSS